MNAAARLIGILDLATVLQQDLLIDSVLDNALSAGVRVVLFRASGASAEAIASVDWPRLADQVRHENGLAIVHSSLDAIVSRDLVLAQLPQHWSSSRLWSQVDQRSGDSSWRGARAQGFGVSTHSEAEIAAAEAVGASWVFASPFMPTVSKPGYGPHLGLPGLQRLCAMTPLPVFALAGVQEKTVKGLGSTGAAGVAVMGMLTQTRAAQELNRLLQRMEDEPWLLQTPW